MRITMVGTGYVGLVSGACFADFGHQVTCVDKNAAKIAALQRGKIPIFEPDLDRLVENNVKSGRLTFSTELTGPVREADAVFIAVGTPSRRGDGHADLSYVYARPREIAAAVSRLHRGDHQIDCASWHRRRSGKTYPRNQPIGRCRRRLESRNFCVKARRSATSSFLTAS